MEPTPNGTPRADTGRKRFAASLMSRPSTKAAGVLLLASGMLYLYCLIYSGGSGDENGPGAVWWLFIFFGVPLLVGGIGLFIMSVIAELNRIKLAKASKSGYGLGSVVVLVLLLVLLVYVIVSINK